jgi:cytochrome c553
MLVGITSNEIGLAIVGAIFIAFAVAVAVVIPRSRPEFPGNRVGLFILVTVLLFVAMITAVVVFAGEEESESEEATPTETQSGETGPAETGPAESGPAAGDAAAGKAVFTSAGCVSCHTLADAGASGTVGPNLDEAKPSAELVVERVTNGKGVMPSFKGKLSEKQIQDVAAYVSSAAGS